MTPLAIASLAAGAAISVLNAPGILAPDKVGAWLRTFPRDKKIGTVLMLVNTVWTGIIVATGQYSDFWIFPERMIRGSVPVLAIVFFFAVIKYADQYLAARGFGILLILAARPMLAAAFVEDSASRLVITVLAYIWVILGIVFVAAPHRMRDAIAFNTRTVERLRLLCAIRFVFGLALMFLAFAVY
jgi:hypothetical protein